MYAIPLRSIPPSPMEMNESVVDVNGQQGNGNNNSGGVRVVGNRIYDSANGKTCHQCRQKTMDIFATCNNLRNEKPCVIKICHKCLKNRYGEMIEEVILLTDWMCPKCRGICNCSFCMKKRGQQPTGALIRTAKTSGFKSVSEMLAMKGSRDLESNSVDDDCQNQRLKKTKLCNGVSDCEVKTNANHEWESKLKEYYGLINGKMDVPKVWTATDFCLIPNLMDDKNCQGTKDAPQSLASNGDKKMHQVNCNANVATSSVDNVVINSEINIGVAQHLNVEKCSVSPVTEKIEEKIDTELTKILDVDFPTDDVCNALQFLEFCNK